MSRRSRKIVRYQRDQARAAQAMAAQNARVSAAQSAYYQTQTQIAANEAEARRLAALPAVCRHCQTANPPGSTRCYHCGSLTFRPPQPSGQEPPTSAASLPGRAWAAFRGKSTQFQVLTWLIVAIIVLGLIASGASRPTNTAGLASASTTGAAETTTPSTPAVAPAAPAPTAAVTVPPVTAQPAATLTVTATPAGATALDIVYDNSGQQTQHTAVALPATYTLGVPGTSGMLASAQNGSGAADATITCTIDLHNGTPPVTNTATGPYSVASCNSG